MCGGDVVAPDACGTCGMGEACRRGVCVQMCDDAQCTVAEAACGAQCRNAQTECVDLEQNAQCGLVTTSCLAVVPLADTRRTPDGGLRDIPDEVMDPPGVRGVTPPKMGESTGPDLTAAELSAGMPRRSYSNVTGARAKATRSAEEQGSDHQAKGRRGRPSKDSHQTQRSQFSASSVRDQDGNSYAATSRSSNHEADRAYRSDSNDGGPSRSGGVSGASGSSERVDHIINSVPMSEARLYQSDRSEAVGLQGVNPNEDEALTGGFRPPDVRARANIDRLEDERSNREAGGDPVNVYASSQLSGSHSGSQQSVPNTATGRSDIPVEQSSSSNSSRDQSRDHEQHSGTRRGAKKSSTDGSRANQHRTLSTFAKPGAQQSDDQRERGRTAERMNAYAGNQRSQQYVPALFSVLAHATFILIECMHCPCFRSTRDESSIPPVTGEAVASKVQRLNEQAQEKLQNTTQWLVNQRAH